MIFFIATINKKRTLLVLAAILALLAAGAVYAYIKKNAPLTLPVELSEEISQQVNQRIAQNLEMLKLFPNDYNVYMDLGNLARQLGKASQAIAYYKKAWATIPTNATPWLNIGNIYIELGNYQQAEKAFLIGKEINPTYYFTYFNLAKLYKDYLKEKSDQVRNVYLEGLKNTNNDYQLLQPFADYLVAIKNYSEALEYLKVLLQKIPLGNRQQILDRINEVENLRQQPAT